MKKIVLAIAVAGTLAGCTSIGNEAIRNETDESLSQKIVKGKSTKADVRAALGGPSFTSFVDGGNEQWTYNLATHQQNPVSYVVGGLYSGGQGKTKNAIVLFDKKGVVLNYSVTEGDTEYRGGIIGGLGR